MTERDESDTRKKEVAGLQVKVDASFFFHHSFPLSAALSGGSRLNFILFVATVELRWHYFGLLRVSTAFGSSISGTCDKRVSGTRLTFSLNVSNFINSDRFVQ